MLKYSISEAEYSKRIENVRNYLAEKDLEALYLTSGTSIFYLTGYSFIATERPAALIIPRDKEIVFMGPSLERDHISLKTRFIEDIRTYQDYPGIKHPMYHFAEFLKDMSLECARIGIDNKSGAAAIWGYSGPSIKDLMEKAIFVDEKNLIPSMRLIKSKAEIELIRESAKWANLAHNLLQEYTSEGLWDVEVALSATYEATKIMKKTLGHYYEPLRTSTPIVAGFRGQIGKMSAIPHSIATKSMIKKGDVLITGAGADIGGYSCELERTMIVGKPSVKQKRYFEVMEKAQKSVMKCLGPSIRCSEVDEVAIKVFKEYGLIHLVKHHTGHGLGLEGHEPPWLDVGNEQLLDVGMVVSCEPGIYETGFAGFRHSDTAVITEDGSEIITNYPRNLDSLCVF